MDPNPYAGYSEFLKAAIKKHWGSGKLSKTDLIAVLLASRASWEVAWEETDSKTLFTGAAGAAALTMLLRTVLGGPLGFILAGASIASLGALYVKHYDTIRAQADAYQAHIEAFEPQYERIVQNEAIEPEQRELMVDGLMARLVDAFEESANTTATDDESK